MQFNQMLLMFSALITLAYSLPMGVGQNNTVILSQNISSVSDAPEDKRPLTVIVEDKNPKSESVVLEFVYNSNSGEPELETKGLNKNKYTVDSTLNREKPDQPKKLNENVRVKLTSGINTEERTQEQEHELKLDQQQKSKEFHPKTITSLMPEEASPLSGKWPKLYYELFNPIQPFPELQYEKHNQIQTPKVQSESADTYLPYFEKERKRTNIAGPLLSPLSIYDREFNVPIFD